ncbi:hypothetical protein D3C81_713220 [compost metagenome]
MKWIWLGILFMISGFIADTVFHSIYGFPEHLGIPLVHYPMLIGAFMGGTAAFRLYKKGETTLNKQWFILMLILAVVSCAGWLLDNLVYHTRDIYEGGPIQEVFHSMESLGALLFFAVSLVISILLAIRKAR